MVSAVKAGMTYVSKIPLVNKVQRFVVNNWQGLFLGLLGAVILGTVIYKFTHITSKKPSDEDVIKSVRSLDVEEIKQCIQNGGNVNARGGNNMTPLMIAITLVKDDFDKAKKAFEALLELNPDFSAQDAAGNTALHYAFLCSSHIEESQNHYFVKRLLEKRADPDIEDYKDKSVKDYASEVPGWEEIAEKAGMDKSKKALRAKVQRFGTKVMYTPRGAKEV